jgi:hypothetical protein
MRANAEFIMAGNCSHILPALAVLMLCAAPARAEPGAMPSASHAGPMIMAQAASAPRWRNYQSGSGKFKVLFPDTPKVVKGRIRTEIGDVVSVRHTAGDGVDSTYDVTYNDYPKAGIAKLPPHKLLDAARDGLLHLAQGRLVSEKPFALGKLQGRDQEITGADGTRYRVRMLLVDNRLYQITAMAQPPSQPDEKTFFESFQLTDWR